MNRLRREMQKVMWTMDADGETVRTPEYKRDWYRLWMLNYIVCAIRCQINVRRD